MAVKTGTNFLIKIDNVVIGGGTGATFEYEVDTVDITNKQSGGWRELLPGVRSWRLTHEGVWNGTDAGLTDARVASINRATVTALLDMDSELTISGTALITSLKTGMPVEDKNTVNLTLEGTGPLTIT